MMKQVLVVDDEADQLETLCRGLLYVGHRCMPARTAGEALAALAAHGEAIDVVLVDMSAPGKPGARVVDQLRSSRPDFPVLVVTGLVLSPLAIAFEKRGLPILKKPFTPDQLGRAIEAALAGSHTRRGEAK